MRKKNVAKCLASRREQYHHTHSTPAKNCCVIAPRLHLAFVPVNCSFSARLQFLWDLQSLVIVNVCVSEGDMGVWIGCVSERGIWECG